MSYVFTTSGILQQVAFLIQRVNYGFGPCGLASQIQTEYLNPYLNVCFMKSTMQSTMESRSTRQVWSLRKKNEYFDAEFVYAHYSNLVSFKINHGGYFSKWPGRRYNNGKVDFVDLIDCDEFSRHEINHMMGMLGYKGGEHMYYHFMVPETDLDFGLEPLGNDDDIRKLLKYTSKYKVIDVYIEHGMTTLTNYLKSPNGSNVVIEELHDQESDDRIVSTVGNRVDEPFIEKQHVLGDEQPVLDDDVEDFDPFYGLFGERDGNLHTDMPPHNTEMQIEVAPKDETFDDFYFDHIDLETIDMDDSDFESGEDSDFDIERRRSLHKLRKERKKESVRTSFYVGQLFGSKEDARNAITNHSIETRRDLWLEKNDGRRLRVKCKGKMVVIGGPSSVGPSSVGPSSVGPSSDGPTCPWVLYISTVKDDKSWVVKTYIDTHNCLQSRNVRQCTTIFLSKQVEETIVPNPEIPLKTLAEGLEKKYRLGVSNMKAYRAKQIAMKKVVGDYAEQYAKLRDYVLELQKSNPNTTVKLQVEVECNLSSTTRQFKRIYICLGGLKQGFKAIGKELLGLDGSFMKRPYPGQILTAVGVDPNQGIYPLAYAVVEAETTDSWSWFLEILQDDLDLNRDSNFTFITDRQKGIVPAMARVFPSAEHRFCIRHIYENMKKQWKGQVYKDQLWKCASATTVPQFKKCMDVLKAINKDAHKWLNEIPYHYWSRAHFTGRAHCDVLLNNMCEVFNRQLVNGRDKPIILALEYIRGYLMRRIVNVQKAISKCHGPLTPTATMLLSKVKEEVSQFVVEWNGKHEYQVTGAWGDQYVVNARDKTCTCRKWEVCGIPCRHVVAAIWNMTLNGENVGLPEHWVHHSYTLACWKDAYEFKVGPVNGQDLWPQHGCPYKLTPPVHHTQVGRPKKKRRKAADESSQPLVKGHKLSRSGKTVTCAKCKKKGHNSRSCKGQEERAT
ncbi:hypothetical protein OSB04_026860 [Centaurea solstitialis]|uniref:SWIM-type domain-containing protein n=1 Tax=Centaurea solstitialis TaxID=347529 RepID=A0AA38SE30_9ASTR|nr:hypothetical protein OSB04_026860 [Centaurea solstitialis]